MINVNALLNEYLGRSHSLELNEGASFKILIKYKDISLTNYLMEYYCRLENVENEMVPVQYFGEENSSLLPTHFNLMIRKESVELEAVNYLKK